jgi:CheY-like chemotaxis protein
MMTWCGASRRVCSTPPATWSVEVARNAEADLLIVDFAMPGMNGAEVVREVRAIRPNLPILMITGYSDTEALAELAPDVPVLRKPFDGGTLLGAAATAARFLSVA